MLVLVINDLLNIIYSLIYHTQLCPQGIDGVRRESVGVRHATDEALGVDVGRLVALPRGRDPARAGVEGRYLEVELPGAAPMKGTSPLSRLGGLLGHSNPIVGRVAKCGE
ncbi:hypothetical protein BHM03_00061052 [Ensete ventricosum]|nr:hypothetical protein BHM03_00061052 [Ensete ventricosum]